MSRDEASPAVQNTRRRKGEQVVMDVMGRVPPPPDTPLLEAVIDFAYGEVWSRPGLDRRSRRWITLACVGAADAPGPIASHVLATLNSGDVTLQEAHEFVLHFAVYAGWPKAAVMDTAIRSAWAGINGKAAVPMESLAREKAERRTEGEQVRFEVMATSNDGRLLDTPWRESLYDFAFGEVWSRPGLDRRARRWITLAAVAASDATVAMAVHIYGALKSGDVSLPEMHEFLLHLALYSGWPKAMAMQEVLRTVVKRFEAGLGPLG